MQDLSENLLLSRKKKYLRLMLMMQMRIQKKRISAMMDNFSQGYSANPVEFDVSLQQTQNLFPSVIS